MLTKEQAEALARPFAPEEIEWRVGQAGKSSRGPWVKALAYLTSRAVMDRLDEVFGVGGWSHSVREVNLGEIFDDKGRPVAIRGMICTLRAGGAEHEDVAECSDIEAMKGAASGSLKRAAVNFGIGRYLYYLEDGFGKISENGKFRHEGKDRKTGEILSFRWDPPALPAWALPAPGAKRYNAYAEPAAVPQGDRKPQEAASPHLPHMVDAPPVAVPEGVLVPDGIPLDFVACVVDLSTKANSAELLTGSLGNASKKLRTMGLTPVVANSKDPIDLVNAILRSKAMILDAEQRRAAA